MVVKSSTVRTLKQTAHQETVREASAVFPEGSPFMKMGDELGTLFQDEIFAALVPKEGQPALAPTRTSKFAALALVA